MLVIAAVILNQHCSLASNTIGIKEQRCFCMATGTVGMVHARNAFERCSITSGS